MRPQLFLTDTEHQDAEARWSSAPTGRRVVIAPGGGFLSKCWPLDSFQALVRGLRQHASATQVVVGGEQDRAAGQVLAGVGAHDWTGQLSLRQSFGVIAHSDLVITNGSMAMHAAAAFDIPTVVLLGEYFASAEAHQKQWGYAGDWCNLGKEVDHPSIFRPEEALRVILPKLAAETRRSPGASSR